MKLMIGPLNSRCRRNGTGCEGSDANECLNIPGTISHYYLTLPSSVPIQNPGFLDLFSLRGHKLPSTDVVFKIDSVNATLGEGAENSNITLAEEEHFFLRPIGLNEKMVSIRKSISGPQDIQIIIDIKTFYHQILSASAKSIIFLHVSMFNY